MGEMSPWHWALVIAVGILLFGAKRLPDAARSLGRSARILKAELHGDDAAPSPAPGATPSDTATPTSPEKVANSRDGAGTAPPTAT